MAITRDPKFSNLPEVQPDGSVQSPATVGNTLWSTDDPRAYGGLPLEAHPNLELARYDATGDGRVDDAR